MYAELTLPGRFNGPPSSGNGGYSAGAMAAAFLDGREGTVQVTLRKPPPLDVPMLISEDRSTAMHGGATVLEAKVVHDEIPVVEPVSYDEAAEAKKRFLGLVDHPFPTCFTCGPDREDGLSIFPGRVDDARVATSWIPDASLSDTDQIGIPITWAALDCPSGWAPPPDSVTNGISWVLGRMAATLEAAPRVGEPHVVMGELRGVDGRKFHTLSTLV